jgi:hypothetical protein
MNVKVALQCISRDALTLAGAAGDRWHFNGSVTAPS